MPKSLLAARTHTAMTVSVALMAAFAAPATASAATYTSGQLSLTCKAFGGLSTLDASTSVAAPASVVPGQSLSASVQVTLAIPSSWYTDLAAVGVSSATVGLSAFPVESAGATPASLNWFATPATETLTTASAPPSASFPASAETVGPATVTGAPGGSVTLTLGTASGGVVASVAAGSLPPQPIVCTAPSPAATLASIPIVAPAVSSPGPGTSSPSPSTPSTSGAAPPTVSGVNPSVGSTSGGTVVTVSGTGFAGDDTVDFGSSPAREVTVGSESSLTAVAPAGAAGPVDVTVTNAAGASATSPSDRFTYVPPDRTATNVNPRVVGVPATTLRLDVTCPATKIACAGSVLVRTADAVDTGKHGRGGQAIRANATLGSASFSLAGGRSDLLTFNLSAANQALLQRYRSLSANVEVTAHDSFGDPGVVTVKTVFRASASRSTRRAVRPTIFRCVLRICGSGRGAA